MQIENINDVYFLKQNDTATDIQLRISDDLGVPVDLTTFTTVEVVIGGAAGRFLTKPVTLLEGTGELQFGLDEGDIVPTGKQRLEVHMHTSGGEQHVAPSKGYYTVRIEQAIDTFNADVSTYTLQVFLNQVDELTEGVADLVAAGNTALTDVTNALYDADTALTLSQQATADINAVLPNVTDVQDNMKYNEPYNAGTAYKKHNVVTMNGSSYMAKQDTQGNPPPSDHLELGNTYWGQVGRKGADGTGTVVVNQDVFTATAGQTVFNLSKTYDQFQNRISVVIGGVAQDSGTNFTETSATQITTTSGVPEGVKVVVNYFSEAQPLATDLGATVAGHTTTLNTHTADLTNVTQQLADTATGLQDLTVNVRRFKTVSNTWNQALQVAIDYALTLYREDVVIVSKAIPANITVKMPKGRFDITTTLISPKGIDFDFTGCTFVASPSDKTVTFMDYTNRVYRAFFERGNFVGFHTAFKVATGNLDSSNMVFKSPTFQSCKYGIDTVSHDKSRSTYLTIENIYSLLTDCAVKTHTDMTSINGGWIYHTGYDGAAIINQGLTEMSNVVCVPSTKQVGARPRWVDNHTTYDGETSFERGLSIRHCRFGGESGSCPVVFNYAKASTEMSSYKASIINIENSYMTGTSEGSAIVLFDMPNKISIKNVSGVINLTNGIIKPDTTFDPDTIPYSKFISIDLDESTKHAYKLIDVKLERFLKRHESLQDMFRYTFEKGLYGQQPCVATVDSKPKFTFKVRFGDRATSGTQKNKGMAFLLTASSGGGSNFAYKNISTYIVHATGVYTSGALYYKLSYSPLKETPGGNAEVDTTSIASLHWGNGDTGSNLLGLSGDASLSTGEITVILSSGVVATAGISIVPLYGNL